MNGDYGPIILKLFGQGSQDSLSPVPDWKCMLGNVVRSWTIALLETTCFRELWVTGAS